MIKEIKVICRLICCVRAEETGPTDVMWNIIYQLVVWCRLQSNRMRGGWIVTEACVKVKGSPEAAWCLFSSQWILSHLIVSTQSSQNWITVEFYLWMWITITALDRRTTPRTWPLCLSFCFSAHLHFDFASFWGKYGIYLSFSVLQSLLVRHFIFALALALNS